jgi:hypothetical protein
MALQSKTKFAYGWQIKPTFDEALDAVEKPLRIPLPSPPATIKTWRLGSQKQGRTRMASRAKPIKIWRLGMSRKWYIFQHVCCCITYMSTCSVAHANMQRVCDMRFKVPDGILCEARPGAFLG